MSEQKKEDRSSPILGKAVPDAINQRMVDKLTIRCLVCEQKILQRCDIKNHYRNHSPSSSTVHCTSCGQKVFNYEYTSGLNKPEIAQYCPCIDRK